MMRGSRLFQHTLTLATGKGAAQLIIVLATPVIARLFEPSDFGQMALFLSLVMVLANFGSLGYERAMVLPKSDSTAISIAKLILIIMLGSGIIFGITTVLLLVYDVVPGIFVPLNNWLLLLPFGVVLMSSMRVLEAWAIRRKNYRSMAYSDVGQATATVGSRIILGSFTGSSLWVLMFGYLAGMVTKLVMQYRLGGRPANATVCPKAGSHEYTIRKAAEDYKDFPLHYTPTAFIRSLSKNLPVLLFGYLFSPAVVGLYSMANRLFRIPIDVLTKAVGNVYLQRASELNNQGKSLLQSFTKSTLALAGVAVLPTAVLMLFGEILCVIVLGDAWKQAGVFVEVLSPWLFTMLIAIPANSIIVVKRRQKMLMWVRFVAIVAQVFGFFAADILWGTPESALACFVYVGIAVNIYIIMYTYTRLIIADHG